MTNHTLLVTGGAGFVGSCFVLQHIAAGDRVITLDKLTYSGSLSNLSAVEQNPRHVFVRGDIGDAQLVSSLLERYSPDAVVNFAAESHVDRSIADPQAFVRTNVLGTATFLRCVQDWWGAPGRHSGSEFRFHQVSTDEVFGSLGPSEPSFSEASPFAPNSPYSASKAASDHFVRAFHVTYGLPVTITHCSNNYGPRQFPEKLIPLVILHALQDKPLPLYGTGSNIRDWLHVADHCLAIDAVLERGRPGQSYCVGGHTERSNLAIVRTLCGILDRLCPRHDGRPYQDRIVHVRDRLGHDSRYSVNCSKLEHELGWAPRHSFEPALQDTVLWYVRHYLQSLQGPWAGAPCPHAAVLLRALED